MSDSRPTAFDHLLADDPFSPPKPGALFRNASQVETERLARSTPKERVSRQPSSWHYVLPDGRCFCECPAEMHELLALPPRPDGTQELVRGRCKSERHKCQTPNGCDMYEPGRCCGHCSRCNWGGRGYERALQEDRGR